MLHVQLEAGAEKEGTLKGRLLGLTSDLRRTVRGGSFHLFAGLG